MRWGFYNKRTHKTVTITDEVFDPMTVALYDPEIEAVYDKETHRVIEKFAWDPDNFKTPEELHTFLTEYLGFEPNPEGIQKKPMTFDWDTDVAEEIIVLDRQTRATAAVASMNRD